MKIGYARTSTLDQNLDLQLDALKNCGCEKIYQEQIVKNSQTMASVIQERGYTIVSGGTENHLMLIDLINKGISNTVSKPFVKIPPLWLLPSVFIFMVLSLNIPKLSTSILPLKAISVSGKFLDT